MLLALRATATYTRACVCVFICEMAHKQNRFRLCAICFSSAKAAAAAAAAAAKVCNCIRRAICNFYLAFVFYENDWLPERAHTHTHTHLLMHKTELLIGSCTCETTWALTCVCECECERVRACACVHVIARNDKWVSNELLVCVCARACD